MALWKPYEETSQNLTKPVVKEERLSPDVLFLNWEQYLTSQQSVPLLAPQAVEYPANYHGHQYPQPIFHPSSLPLSPVSVSSTCSGYENAAAVVVPSPIYASRPVVSPPESYSLEDPYDIDDELSRDPAFKAYEKIALKAIAEEKGGSLLGNNPRMRRFVKRSDDDGANDSYRRQRDRNNIAAKQSRDRRKLREHKLSVRVEYLLGQVAQLDAALKARGCRRLRCSS